jgi:hypothetical protein
VGRSVILVFPVPPKENQDAADAGLLTFCELDDMLGLMQSQGNS